MTKKEEIEINGETYVKKSSTTKATENWITKNKEGKTMCIVRTYSAGVFYGLVDYENAKNLDVEVYNATRIWYWNGAFTLSEMAVDGVKEAEDCKLAVNVPLIRLNRWCELIPMSKKAIACLDKIGRKQYEG